MKRAFFKSLLIFGVLALFGLINLGAAEKVYTEKEARQIESQLFMQVDDSIISNGAKLANFLANDGDPQAKCWFGGWRSYYTPCYYYYDWYCDWYQVPLRIIYYTVPTQPVVTVTPAVTTTTVSNVVTTSAAITTTLPVTSSAAVASVETAIIAKSSNTVVKGAVIDKTVPQDSPLFKMGLRAGDIIAKINGKPVSSMIDIRRMSRNSEVVFIRGHQIKVADKQPLTKVGSDLGKSSMTLNTKDINLKVLEKAQKRTMSLYEYYDSLEKE